MKKVVIIPGGFHPFHAGHYELYKSALEAFPDSDVYVAASNVQTERPFPFKLKQKLAQIAGVPANRFVQVKAPFDSSEITSKYDPNNTILIFVKSEKNSKTGSDPEGPFPAEIDPATGKLPLAKKGRNKGKPVSDTLQYYKGNEDNLQPMSRHKYLAYLPTVEFGPGIKSGSEVRKLWPKLSNNAKLGLVYSMYPSTKSNEKLAGVVLKAFDQVMGDQISEAYPKQQISRYNPDGTTYRGEKLPVDDPDDIYNKGTKVPLSTLQNVSADEPNIDSSIKNFIKNRMDLLEPKEQKILKLRFWYGMTLEEIADRVELSPNRIRQIEAHAMRKLIQPNLDINPKEIMRMYVPESQDYLEEK